MSETASSAPASRARKVRAVLAGGLVLGVGAAITLAAWNDSEFATGQFEAGTFNLEGSVDGEGFTEHASEEAAAPLAFSVNSSNLSPGDSVSAPFAVRLDAETTHGAGVSLDAVGTTGTVAGLTYTVGTTTSFGCDAGTVETLVEAGTPLGEIDADGAAFDLEVGSESEVGEPMNLCFTVTADDGLAQGQEGTATWQFLATSED